MVLVSTMKAATLHARVVLAAMSLAALLVLAWTLAVPVAAQEETAPLQDAAVTIETDEDNLADRIQIAATGCDVEKGATVTSGNGEPVVTTFVNGDTRDAGEISANIRATADQIVIDDIEEADLRESETEGSNVTDSSGITCDNGGGQRAADDDADDVRAADDDLENLSCAELLVLFRGEGEGQYGDDGTAVDLNDSEVRAQIEVCLEREIVNNPGGNLPNTGGVSLLALAVLGVATAVAGVCVIRGGRR